FRRTGERTPRGSSARARRSRGSVVQAGQPTTRQPASSLWYALPRPRVERDAERARPAIGVDAARAVSQAGGQRSWPRSSRRHAKVPQTRSHSSREATASPSSVRGVGAAGADSGQLSPGGRSTTGLATASPPHGWLAGNLITRCLDLQNPYLICFHEPFTTRRDIYVWNLELQLEARRVPAELRPFHLVPK